MSNETCKVCGRTGFCRNGKILDPPYWDDPECYRLGYTRELAAREAAEAQAAAELVANAGLRAALRDIDAQLATGFIRCETCGDQEDTADMDVRSDIAAALSAAPPNAMGAQPPAPASVPPAAAPQEQRGAAACGLAEKLPASSRKEEAHGSQGEVSVPHGDARCGTGPDVHVRSGDERGRQQELGEVHAERLADDDGGQPGRADVRAGQVLLPRLHGSAVERWRSRARKLLGLAREAQFELIAKTIRYAALCAVMKPEEVADFSLRIKRYTASLRAPASAASEPKAPLAPEQLSEKENGK